MKKILLFCSVLAIVVGILMVVGGVWGIVFTHNNIAREKITTPMDASIPNVPVRGPLTLKSQSDIIRFHTLRMTKGETYSQMPQKVSKLDSNGNPILDDKGELVMIPNDARNIWVTATTLTTALNLGIITYLFSSLIVCFGLISILTGIIFLVLRRRL